MGNAKHSFGTKLKKGADAIAELTEIGGVSMSADAIDVTTLDSADGFREFVGGLKDGGEVGVSGYFYPGDTDGQKAMYDDFVAGTVNSYAIEFPAALNAKWEFDGIVTAYTTGAALEDPVSFEATIKVTGKPVLTVLPA